jgi:CheY-like chemotaxis protein
MDKTAYSVLVVDDSEPDRFILRRTLQRFPKFKLIAEVEDGEEAIGYLSGKAPFDDRHKNPLPDLMLLDLKMPRKSGFDVLHWLRGHPLPSLTVIILSSSPLAEDIGASLALGAHGYWTKAAAGERQVKIIQEIEELLDKRNLVHAGAR